MNFPIEIFTEIFKYIEYKDQGPIRRSCRALYRIPLTFTQATSPPSVLEVAHFLFEDLKLVRTTGKSQLFPTSLDGWYGDKHARFLSDSEHLCLRIHPERGICQDYIFGLVDQEEREFETVEDLVSTLRGFRFDLDHLRPNNLTIYRYLCKNRPFHSYDTDTFVIQLSVQLFKRPNYPDICREQSALLHDLLGLYSRKTWYRIEKIVGDVYGQHEAEQAFDDDWVPMSDKVREIFKFIVEMVSKFTSFDPFGLDDVSGDSVVNPVFESGIVSESLESEREK